MKKLLIVLLVLGGFSSLASVEFSAIDMIDRGSYIEVIEPHIVGCANGSCYGGEHIWFLRPSFSKNKICKKLGFKKYVRGSKLVHEVADFDRFSKLKYHVLYRSGYPGDPSGGRPVNVLQSIECKR